MPTFAYRAKKGPQESFKGIVEAKNRAQAIAVLEQKGLFLINIEEEAPRKNTASKRIRRQDLSVFTRQFANLIESGLTITQGLSILSQQTVNPALKSVISGMEEQIKDGATLSKALSDYPRQFSKFYCSIVNAGEISGALETTLSHLADFSEQEEKIRSDVLSALTYPALILSVGIITIYILLTYAVPQLTSMFTETGETLPIATQILINISDTLRSYGWLIILAGFGAVLAFKRAQNSKERIVLDKLFLNLPLMGKIILKSEISRFMRTLSLLLESGVTILASLDAVTNTVTNTALKEEIQKASKDIKDGESLSSALKKSPYFPAYAVNIISVGEESGTIEKSLKRIAGSYEQELSRLIRTMTSLLEPVMILVMGIVVAFIVSAMLLPIFEINLIAK